MFALVPASLPNERKPCVRPYNFEDIFLNLKLAQGVQDLFRRDGRFDPLIYCIGDGADGKKQ